MMSIKNKSQAEKMLYKSREASVMSSQRISEDKMVWITLDWITARILLDRVKMIINALFDITLQQGLEKSAAFIEIRKKFEHLEKRLLRSSTFYCDKGTLERLLSQISQQLILSEQQLRKMKGYTLNPFKLFGRWRIKASINDSRKIKTALSELLAHTK